ncbi:MAG: tRNA (guanine(10)-N(2))-dimethyltransferase [Candidatus Thorarchaeota archaeon]
MTVEKEYTEGRTTFLSADVKHYAGEGQPTADIPVFYNPRMQVNRDISVAILTAYLKETSVDLICEPLAGSGVRTLRYLIESQGDFRAKMFDLNPAAVEMCRKNVERNKLQDRAKVIRGNAKILLITESKEQRFDFVDLDPFGTPAPYIDPAIQSLNPRGSMLGITATDMAVLCGVYPRVALRKYGGYSIRSPFTHELAVRLLYGMLYQAAGKQDYGIEPVASLSTDHYVRIWAKLDESRRVSNRQAHQIGFISFCPVCMEVETQPLRTKGFLSTFEHAFEDCHGLVQTAGPLWLGVLYDSTLLGRANAIAEQQRDYFAARVPKLMSTMLEEEALMKIPYVDIHALCDAYSLTPPATDDIMQMLKDAGYASTRTHFTPTAIRTDASIAKLVETMKELNKGR